MSTLYQRALGLSAVVLVAALVALALAAASTVADRQRAGAEGAHGSVADAGRAVANLLRTRRLAFADSATAALARGRTAATDLRAADAQPVNAALAAYEASVGRLRAAIAAQGTDKESGAYGEFRERIHAVEARVERASPQVLVHVLQARRREKDYQLRGDLAYVPQVRAHVRQATQSARTSLPPAQADTTVALLRAYEDEFLHLVELSRIVEFETDQIDRAAAAADRVARPLARRAASEATLLQRLSLLASLLSAVVVGAAVLYQTRGLTAPVARLRDAAERVAAGETAVRVPIEGPDEVRTLVQALNGVADYAHRTAEVERHLRETQRFLATVLGRAQEGVVVLDADYRVTYANPYAERLYGTTLAAVRGRCPDDIFAYVDQSGRKALFFRALRGEVVHASDMAVTIGPRRLWIASTYAPLASEDGEVRGVVITVSDVTARVTTERALRAAKEEAEAAARLKSAFLANMSHEIRTPLTGIIGYADMLAEEAPAEAADLAGVIQRSGHRLLDTLNSVLDIAQLESGTMEIGREPVDASGLVAEAAELYTRTAHAAGLSLTTEVEPAVRVEADLRALRRVLANLVANAIKFTPEGGVTIRAWSEGGCGVLEVEDTGIGMSEAFMARMFDEFQQESVGHARTHEGNGLGLTIVHRLTGLMGGTLDVHSVQGEGTRFSLRLPSAGVAEAEVHLPAVVAAKG